MRRVALASTLLFTISLPAIAAEPTPEQKREIESIIQKLVDAFNDQNYTLLVDYYSKDVNVVGPLGIVHGKDAFQKTVEQNYSKLSSKLTDIKMESAVLHDNKTMFVTTSYSFIVPNAPQAKGTWFYVFEQEPNGAWKISNYIIARRTAVVPSK